MSRLIPLLYLSVFLFASVFSLSAATLSGTVYDQNNAPKSGVRVAAGNDGIADTTDNSGTWILHTGPAGISNRNNHTAVTEIAYARNRILFHLGSSEKVRISMTDIKGAATGPVFLKQLSAGTYRIPLNEPKATMISFLHVRIGEVEATVPVFNGLPLRFTVPGTGLYVQESGTAASVDKTELSYSWEGTVLAADSFSAENDTSGIIRFLTIPPYEGIPWNDSVHYGVLIDKRDNATYRTITVDSRTWMAQNLNFGSQTNGEDTQDGSAGEKYCYKDISARCDTFGGLYQWHTAMALDSEYDGESAAGRINDLHRGICPQGWHVPTSDEWSDLKKYANEYAGNDSMSAQTLKSTDNWATEMGWGPGTDDLGFRAIAGGGRYYEGYNSKETGSESFFRWCCRFRGMFWTASEADDTTAYYEDISDDKTSLTRMSSPKTYGFCVRCVKD